jgi:hypothetical protein
MRDGLLLIADTHVNSTTGLCPPEGIELDDGGRYQPSKAQRWLWQCYQDVLADAAQLATTCDRFMVWFLGDLVDKIGKGTQLVTYNDPAIVKAGVAIIEAAQPIASCGVGIIRGTSAHVGDSGALEEAVAKAVGARPYPPDSGRASSWNAKLDLQGRIIWLAHHGKIGGLPHTKLNALGNVCYAAIAEAIENSEPLPALVAMAHTHHKADTHDEYPVRVVQVPSFQLTTEHGNRIKPFRTLPIGGALVTVEDGRLDVTFKLFRPSPEAAYCPTNESTSPKPNLSPQPLTPNQAEQLI